MAKYTLVVKRRMCWDKKIFSSVNLGSVLGTCELTDNKLRGEKTKFLYQGAFSVLVPQIAKDRGL